MFFFLFYSFLKRCPFFLFKPLFFFQQKGLLDDIAKQRKQETDTRVSVAASKPPSAVELEGTSCEDEGGVGSSSGAGGGGGGGSGSGSGGGGGKSTCPELSYEELASMNTSKVFGAYNPAILESYLVSE